MLALWEAMREPAKELRHTPIRPALSDYQLHKKLVEATRKKKGPGRKHWEGTNAKNKELREATKSAIEKWKDDPPLDHANRDPNYWTPDRKERRRLESLAKKKEWMVRT